MEAGKLTGKPPFGYAVDGEKYDKRLVPTDLGREWVPWILVADQLVFAAMDVVTGFWVDRVRAALRRFGGCEKQQLGNAFGLRI